MLSGDENRGGGFLLVFLILAAIVGGIFLKGYVDNRHYAARIFLPVVAFDHVLASEMWNLAGIADPVRRAMGQTTPVFCSHAVVALAPETADMPPPVFVPTRREKAYFVFGRDDWRKTPGPQLLDDDRWAPCATALGKDLFAQLALALNTSGGWWDETESALFLYAPNADIAARMMLTD